MDVRCKVFGHFAFARTILFSYVDLPDKHCVRTPCKQVCGWVDLRYPSVMDAGLTEACQYGD